MCVCLHIIYVYVYINTQTLTPTHKMQTLILSKKAIGSAPISLSSSTDTSISIFNSSKCYPPSLNPVRETGDPSYPSPCPHPLLDLYHCVSHSSQA